MYKFSRQYRLVTKKDFQSVFTDPQKIKYKYLLVLCCPNAYSHARLGIMVSKKIVKKATDRNLIKRIIRESFRHQKEYIKGLDIIVLLRSECTPLNKQVLRNDVDHLWSILAISLKKS